MQDSGNIKFRVIQNLNIRTIVYSARYWTSLDTCIRKKPMACAIHNCTNLLILNNSKLYIVQDSLTTKSLLNKIKTTNPFRIIFFRVEFRRGPMYL